MDLANSSQLAVERLFSVDGAGAEALVVVAKGTWMLEGNAVRWADEQIPLRHSDGYRGDAVASSMQHPSDLAPSKPATDCLLLGHAYAPSRDTRQLNVSFGVGSVSRSAVVFGRRHWTGSKGQAVSKAEPFDKLPLIYELAFGGSAWADNPVGIGFVETADAKDATGTPLPQIEDPRALMDKPTDRPPTVGFGALSPSWAPRAAHAGTYDAAWRRDRAPLPPDDLDARFHCAAPPALRAHGFLRGDERIVVDGAARNGRLEIRLPCVRPRIAARLDLKRCELSPVLDTVIVEPDEQRVQLVWRARLEDVSDHIYSIRALSIELEAMA